MRKVSCSCGFDFAVSIVKCHYEINVWDEKAAERQQIEFAIWGQNYILKCSATKCPEKNSETSQTCLLFKPEDEYQL